MAINNKEIDPRIIELNGRPLTQPNNQTGSKSNEFILDKDWAKQAFLINDVSLGNRDDIANRYWSSASSKFTDTRLGANIGINSRPQFTRYSDIRVKGRLSGRNDVSVSNTLGNYGMGRYYSEAIDDPSQTIYLRFGVPQYNSLFNFLSKAFDRQQLALAKTGRGTSIFYDLANAAGTISTFIAFPAIAITIAAGRAISAFFVRPTSKFYTLKPTMHLYWSTVNLLVNTIAINKGLFPKVLTDESNDTQNIGEPFKLDNEYLDLLSKALPDTFRGINYFDMYAIANKAQRLANQLIEQDFKELDNGTATKYTGYVKKELTGDGTHTTIVSNKNSEPTLIARLQQLAKFDYYKTESEDTPIETDPRIDPNDQQGKERTDRSWFTQFKDSFSSEFNDGSQFAIFKVDYTGQMDESFGNSVVESDISQKINSQSSSAREARFSFADGNVGGEVLQSVIGAATDVATGALDGLTMGFSNILAALGGSGFIDIPKHWQSSTATLPRANYTMSLVTPYGNVISQMQNIYIPLCMMLAGTLPLSTGKASYTSPFICELFDRGKCQVKLGMIESLSISRGTTNLAFDLKGAALGINVSFTIVDLSSIMHMPVSSGKLGEHNTTLDEDNILSDYLAVLANQSMDTQIYSMSKAKLTLAKSLLKGQTLTSPAYWASLTHEETTSGMLKYITFGAFNALEGINRGTALAK